MNVRIVVTRGPDRGPDAVDILLHGPEPGVLRVVDEVLSWAEEEGLRAVWWDVKTPDEPQDYIDQAKRVLREQDPQLGRKP